MAWEGTRGTNRPLMRRPSIGYRGAGLILDHMARVRKATTCAQRVLEGNAHNCGAFDDAYLDKIIRLMVRRLQASNRPAAAGVGCW